MEINPYQAPEDSSPLAMPYHGPRFGAWVDGKLLVVQSGERLPPICIKTNQPLSEQDMVTKTLYWCSPLLLLLILINLIIFLIVYMIARKQCILTIGLHPSVRSRRRWTVLVKVLVVVGLFFAMLFAAAADSDSLIIVFLILFFVALIIACLGNSPVSIAKYRDGMFWIRGCCPEYLAEIENYVPRR
ncbi:MAG: hypothetical protein JW818_04520 [Pirellulales bacterium]|nr:hypothetical protein [Pirellulales bacterium]